ncbi:hypothetical protein [Sandaracinus amylolyticus]|uniref:Uncharacterized protein n=1 Tax=Sandaracinus amylolyticus TaxID=927083 RepID=A0A0F6VYQ8_9BACT|nr:hypothetical protein [Sandaracinus amylolyticus]AKF03031.1 hypothetical protein DB32_000180 [Sandaracinus amylolyticus]
MSDTPSEPSSVGGLHVIAVVAIVIGVLASVPAAFLVSFASPVPPTPTQAALAGWLVWVVPIAALVLDALTRGRALWRVLAIGGGSAVVWCAVALVLFGRYPSGGPHEAVALGIFVLTVVTAVVLGARALRDRISPRRGMAVAVLVVVLAGVGGTAATRLFANELAWTLPVTAYPVRQHHYVDFVGVDIEYASAPIDRASFDALVRERELVRGAPPDAPTYDAFAPSWFHIDERAEVYVDPTARSSDHSWCWSIAAWNGADVMLTHGCAW